MSETQAAAASPSSAMIELQAVNKWYGEFHVLRDINLQVGKGEKVVVCGPSGSGKSTMIRCINRLEEHQQGRITVAGIELNADMKNIDAVRREVGMVFQQFNLFPHLTVLQNLTLAPIRVLRKPRLEAEAAADALLRQFGLLEKRKEYPDRLSGGQQQRAAIARALAMQPRLMLLDEVTSALDPELVAEVLNVIRSLAQSGMTMVIATHEMWFARDIATRVCFLDGGMILEQGPPEQIFREPQQDRTKQFLQSLTDAGRL